MLTYKNFATEHPNNFCWACGRAPWQRVENWHAQWFLHRAHLGKGSGSMKREESIKAINLLCPRCHELHCGLDWKTIGGIAYPTISNGNMLWLKRQHDLENYDEEYLKAVWRGPLPALESVRGFFEEEYRTFQGVHRIGSHHTGPG